MASRIGFSPDDLRILIPLEEQLVAAIEQGVDPLCRTRICERIIAYFIELVSRFDHGTPQQLSNYVRHKSITFSHILPHELLIGSVCGKCVSIVETECSSLEREGYVVTVQGATGQSQAPTRTEKPELTGAAGVAGGPTVLAAPKPLHSGQSILSFTTKPGGVNTGTQPLQNTQAVGVAQIAEIAGSAESGESGESAPTIPVTHSAPITLEEKARLQPQPPRLPDDEGPGKDPSISDQLLATRTIARHASLFEIRPSNHRRVSLGVLKDNIVRHLRQFAADVSGSDIAGTNSQVRSRGSNRIRAMLSAANGIINNGDIILTAGFSPLVLKFTTYAAKKRSISVYVAERAPFNDGRKMATLLASKGVTTTLIPDSSLNVFGSRISSVVVEPSVVLMNGGAICDTGCSLLTLVAQRYSRPLYCLCEKYQFTSAFPTREILEPQTVDPGLIVQEPGLSSYEKYSDVNLYVPTRDYLGPESITCYVTCEGIYSPENVYQISV